MDLDKVIALFTGPNSESLYDRHYAGLDKLCKNSVGGIAICDLPKVEQILRITLGLLQKGVTGFVQPTVELVG
jgi:hypothetical protein